ncbi:MAG: hypothetical protein FJY85_17115, partial [Deltaproteobacteria bacterium]|nr:hypothetical protein [Deltaproteobacteria bacterium]
MTERPPVVHPVLACFFGVTTWSVPRVLATLTAALVLVSPLVVNVPRAETIEEIENCYGNRIVYGELFEPNDLNPLAPDLNTSALRLREMIYEGLYTINKKGEYEPLLARSYRQVGDTLLVVSLRTDIWWHDGTKFKTDDVIFTYECLLQNAEFSSAEVRKLAGRIKHVRALGSDAIEFRVEQMPRFPEVLLAIRILPSHLFSNCTSDAIRSGLPDGRLRKPVGTGPFVFGQRHPFFGTVSLQANRDYYLYPAFDRELTRFGSRRGPFLDAIEMRPYPSAVGEVSDLRGGI